MEELRSQMRDKDATEMSSSKKLGAVRQMRCHPGGQAQGLVMGGVGTMAGLRH